MKIRKLNIENFRHIKDTEIVFGDKLTIISGQNGTGKSSILGWVAQLCDFKKKNKRLNEESFKEDFKNVFKFCSENDYDKNYKVVFTYKDDNFLMDAQKTITTRFQQKTGKSAERYRTDFDGRGKALDFPIIYLGLKRLIPLATERKIAIKPQVVPQKYNSTFSRLAKEILILIDNEIKPESIKSSNKDLLAMKTEKYGHLGNSAGQDNLGQIISSILSFQKLKDELGDEYNGGIILIDEIDATLYAGSQINLVDKLFRFASMLDLQIIFTTHSLEILEHLDKKLGDETISNHLILKDTFVSNVLNPSFEYVSNKIKDQIKQENKILKKKFICEDKVAEHWAKNLLNGTDLKKMIQIEKGPFPDGTIVSMAESKHSIFNDVGFILDGDVRKKFKDKQKPQKTIFLPDKYRPETVMYKFLYGLSDNDEFWNDELNFIKRTCFRNYTDSGKGTHKRWFEDPNNKKFFGQSYSKLFNRWKKDNKTIVNQFQNEMKTLV